MNRRLLVVHRNQLDEVMPRHRFFKWVFKRFHRLLIALGGRNMHVAEYAKKWNFLYQVLNKNVVHNALRVACELNFEAIACGHTHAAMDVERNGRRYFNTGSWTEKPLHYLLVDAELIQLRVYGDGEV